METKLQRGRVRARLSALRGNEAVSGLVLIASAILALVLANSPLSNGYFHALEAKVGPLSIHHWINDLLMSAFFLLVGLEVKREFLEGALASPSSRTLPIAAALGGCVVPALLYIGINPGGEGLRGWAVPVATDIAFALGVLALFGSRIPPSLRTFLAALAIIDDLVAVAIIAFVYTDALFLPWLGAAALVLGLLAWLSRRGTERLLLYLLPGLLLWVFTFLSGVHATLAGVALAAFIPIRSKRGNEPPLHRLEHGLQPWIAFVALPLFGFANAGVSLAGLGLDVLARPLALGVAVGLFVGKQAGVFVSSWAAIRLGFARRPEQATLGQIYGVSLLCGIGFTMSLFIGPLAFSQPELQSQVKIGVLLGSFLSALAGAAVLALSTRRASPAPASMGS